MTSIPRYITVSNIYRNTFFICAENGEQKKYYIHRKQSVCVYKTFII